VRLGRVGGVEIGINWTWLIIAGLIVWSLADAVFPEENPGLGDGAYIGMAAAAALLFFGSLLLHELGHALQARREGMEIAGITLWVFGGVARFKGMFPSAGAEFRVAIAGPLVTLVLSGVFIGTAAIADPPASVDGVLTWVGQINLLLLAFNLLPALPLDGGRVLRSALWQWRGDLAWATLVAGGLGRLMGQTMIFGGFFLALTVDPVSGVWLALIGWFLTVTAGAEAALVAAREALRGLSVADAMIARPVTVRSDDPLSDVERVLRSSRHTVYPVVDDGEAVGLLPFGSVAATARRDRAALRVRDRMVPAAYGLVVTDEEDLAEVLAPLIETELHRALVIHGSRFAGLLSVTDVERLLQLHAPRPIGS
jgi:Zn-dependent protease